MTAGGGLPRFALALLWLAGILTAGFAARAAFFRAARDLTACMATAAAFGRLELIGRVISNALVQALGLLVFAAVSFALFVVFFDKGDPGYELVSVYLLLGYYVLILAAAARIIFAPGAPALRLFPMPDDVAHLVHRRLMAVILGAAVVTGASLVLDEAGVGRSTFLLVYSLSGVYFVLALLALIWSHRKPVAAALQPAGGDAAGGGALAALARAWHWPASAYVVGMGVFWISDVLIGGDARVGRLILSLFVIPVAIGVDLWGQRLIRLVSGELTEVVDLSGDRVREIPPVSAGKDFKTYVPLIRRLFRIALAGFTFFVMQDLWGVDLAIGRIFTSHVLSIAVTLLLGFIVWELIKARIDARLRLEMPSADEDAEEGGPGGTRLGTLLTLLRKFVLAVLVVIITLIVLSSLGVNIGPLIAGAGVVGLAIGFGAQALVRDIIAGVFFLIDDAFRIGDYVESTGVKGMVEHISLRSIKLRHPRGMVYTIPFGNLRSITNFSRDYTITKLDIRVGFDTDLEQVRKVVKKINKALRKDEEHQPDHARRPQVPGREGVRRLLDDRAGQVQDAAGRAVQGAQGSLPYDPVRVPGRRDRVRQPQRHGLRPARAQAGAGGDRPEHPPGRRGRGPGLDPEGRGNETQGGRREKTRIVTRPRPVVPARAHGPPLRAVAVPSPIRSVRHEAPRSLKPHQRGTALPLLPRAQPCQLRWCPYSILIFPT